MNILKNEPSIAMQRRMFGTSLSATFLACAFGEIETPFTEKPSASRDHRKRNIVGNAKSMPPLPLEQEFKPALAKLSTTFRLSLLQYLDKSTSVDLYQIARDGDERIGDFDYYEPSRGEFFPVRDYLGDRSVTEVLKYVAKLFESVASNETQPNFLPDFVIFFKQGALQVSRVSVQLAKPSISLDYPDICLCHKLTKLPAAPNWLQEFLSGD
jgi:hypothetical protein